MRSCEFVGNMGLAGGENSKVLLVFASAMAVSDEQRSIGMRHMELVEER